MNSRAVVGMVLGLFMSGPALAIPVQLDAVSFAAQIAGLDVQVEDFEAETQTLKGFSYTFLNGTYSSTSQAVVTSTSDPAAPVCGVTLDRCLVAQSVAAVRLLDAFPADTLYWSASMHFLRQDDSIRVRVTGGSGVLDLVQTAPAFFGFSDPLGILSVEFENLGSGPVTGNYSLDDITTAQAAVVRASEPGTPALLLTLAALPLLARRRQA